MKKKMRLPIAMLLSLMLTLSMTAVPSFAGSAPSIEDVEYEGSGKVDVEFYGDVQYKKTKVTVKDSSGKKYSASILHKDDDDIKFKIKKYKTGKTYKFTISGIKRYGASKYTSVKGKVKIPASGKVKVKDVDYDAEDQTVDIEFKGKVKWNSPTVSITKNGTNYALNIVERDNDSIEVRVNSLNIGSKYSYKVTGVKNRDGGSYTTVKGSFTAYDD